MTHSPLRTRFRWTACAAAAALTCLSVGAPAHADTVTGDTCALLGESGVTSANATSTPYIMTYAQYQYAVQNGDGSEGDGVFDIGNLQNTYLLMGTGEYANPSDPQVAGAIPVAYFQSYEDFFSALKQYDEPGASAPEPAIPSDIHWVAYVPNSGNATPGDLADAPGSGSTEFTGGDGEQGDPPAALAGFIQLAHANGYQVIVAPSPNLTGSQPGPETIEQYVTDSWQQEASPMPVPDGDTTDVAPWPDETGMTIPQVSGLADIYSIQGQAYEETADWLASQPNTNFRTEFPTADGPNPDALQYFPYFLQRAGQEAQASASANGASVAIFGGFATDDVPNAQDLSQDTLGGGGYTAANALTNAAGTAPLISGYWLNSLINKPANLTMTDQYLAGDAPNYPAVPVSPACSLSFSVNGAFYTAADGNTTETGSADLVACSQPCEGGELAEAIGTSRAGTFTLEDITETAAGTYPVTIYYASPATRSVVITPNGNSSEAVTVSFPATATSSTIDSLTVNLPLGSGSANTIEFSGNGTATAPWINEIYV